MKKLISTTIRFVLAAFLLVSIYSFKVSSFLKQSPTSDTTKILVVGTIHGNHETNRFYTYQDIENIIATYHPDAICVEIPEDYFRKQSYLKEMMIATIYGTDHSIKVYPIDWWAPGNDRAEFREYAKTEDYKIKSKKYDELEKSDSIMQKFYAKHKSNDAVYDENKEGYEFFNGDEYNNYIREMYKINIAVFGDGCMNLHYITRNNNMLAFIDKAIDENKGKKIIVLTGAEHKHYFDDKLSERTGLKVIKFNEILPLKQSNKDANITNFIENDIAKGYYNVNNKAEEIDMEYQSSLISLIHGMNMDDDPSIISVENIKKAEQRAAQWEKENPHSVYLAFELGWINFLKKDYKQAIVYLNKIANRLNETPQDMQWFIKSFYYRNLGFCYDMLGDHANAVKNYNAGIEICKKLNRNNDYIKSVYKNFIAIPYDGKYRK